MKKNKIKVHVAIFFLAGILSACASGPASSSKPTMPAQDASSNACPTQHREFKASVDTTLDNLSTDELTALAEAGRTDAMVLLALRYGPAPENPASGSKPAPDMNKSLALLQQAVDKENADAEFLMGTLYINGLNVPLDETKAAYWFERGARHGNPVAQFWYGEMLAKGRGGMTSDWKAALPYFRKAAEQGVPDAFLEIGYMYVNGYDGAPPNPHKAAFCYRQMQFKSPLVQYSLRKLIDDKKIVWEPGDPGKPVEETQEAPTNQGTPPAN